jgi:hypothetical protein
MKSHDNTPFAFPCTFPASAIDYAQHGITLREYFAAYAMQAAVAARRSWGLDEVAEYAFALADAMIKRSDMSDDVVQP